MANGLAMEMEELGTVALIGVLLVPGVLWIADGKSTVSMVGRMLAVGAVVGAAVAIEAALDGMADPVMDTLEGKG